MFDLVIYLATDVVNLCI